MKMFDSILNRIVLGSGWQERAAKARPLVATINQTTRGGMSIQFNGQGERIRGVYKKQIKFSVPAQHPLVTKYYV